MNSDRYRCDGSRYDSRIVAADDSKSVAADESMNDFDEYIDQINTILTNLPIFGCMVVINDSNA